MSRFNIIIRLMLLALGLSLPGSSLLAGPQSNTQSNFLVLGVIASSKNQQGVALLKDQNSSHTFAVREGSAFSPHAIIKSVGRKLVEVMINKKIYMIPVGGDTDSAVAAGAMGSSSGGSAVALTEVEKVGDTVNVSKAMKDHIVNNDLGKVLMQAAAVPHLEGGRLSGFQLWEIEPKSVFEVAGLQNGDLVTGINGYEINDVGAAIRQLNSMKTASEASFEYVRNGIKQQLKIVVQ